MCSEQYITVECVVDEGWVVAVVMPSLMVFSGSLGCERSDGGVCCDAHIEPRPLH